MGKKYRNLIQQIIRPDNLRNAYHKAATGKRMSVGALQFKEHAEANLNQLAHEISFGNYQQGEFHYFTVYEPKRREIASLPFRDRVVQHALVNVIAPIFENTFLPMSYACRKGKGTHKGAIRAQSIMRRLANNGPVYCLKMDFSKYFASIDRAVLHRAIQKKISCRATLQLIETFTEKEGKGLPIGNLTSQLYANIYGTLIDRAMTQNLKVKNSVRYMDDTVVFSNHRGYLQGVKELLEWFIQNITGLKFSRWSIQNISRGVNFLGYRIWTTHKLIRKDSVKRARRKIQRLTGERLDNFKAAWGGHTQWADTHNLQQTIGATT